MFLDETTAHAIQWPALWKQFSPVTVYGQRLKQQMVPFTPGQDEQYRTALRQLEHDIANSPNDVVKRVRSVLAKLPDVRGIVETLQSGNAVLAPKELLLLKQFLVAVQELAAEPVLPGLVWPESVRWHSLFAAFGGDRSTVFSLDHAGGPTYTNLAREVTLAHGQRAQAVRNRDLAILGRTGHRPSRDGMLHLPLPAHRTLADTLKADAQVQWVKETPFECVFDVLPTDAMTEADVKIEASQAQLDELSRVLLASLTAQLAGQITTWLELLKVVGELDIRLAKVQLSFETNGCVPTLGAEVRLSEGVHTVVANRLHEPGFTPLSLNPAFGVNLICGSNMGGKTVSMMTVCICQILAQYALPVPATSFETVLFEAVRFCGSAETDVLNGLSSFGTEVHRMSEVWSDVEPMQRVLLCFDEPGRSTNPVEGEAIAIGIVRSIRSRAGDGWIGLMATHFSAPAMEPGVSRFKMRGLVRERLTGTAAGTAGSVGGPEAVGASGSVGGPRSIGLPDAIAAPGTLKQADTGSGIEERLRRLEQAMSYVIEPWNDGDAPHEALHVAEWLGAPSSILENTKAYLRRGRPS